MKVTIEDVKLHQAIVRWLRKNEHVSSTFLERKAKIPRGTLHRVKKGERDIPVHHLKPLRREIDKLVLVVK